MEGAPTAIRLDGAIAETDVGDREAAPSRTRRGEWLPARGAGLAGLVFVALVVLAAFVGLAPEADETDAAILAYYTDSTNQARQVLTAVSLALAALSFLAFATGLVECVRRGARASWWPALAGRGATIFVTLVLAAVAVGTAVPATFVFSDRFELDVQTARVILTMGNLWLLGFAGMAAGLFLAAATLGARGSGLLPAWLVWSGLVIAVPLLFSVPLFGFPLVGLVLWVLPASICLLRERAQPAAA